MLLEEPYDQGQYKEVSKKKSMIKRLNKVKTICFLSSGLVPVRDRMTESLSFSTKDLVILQIQSNLVIWRVLIRNKLVLRNHFRWPIVNLLHKDKEHLVLRNNFRVTKKFFITKFDCTKIFCASPKIYLRIVAAVANILCQTKKMICIQ